MESLIGIDFLEKHGCVVNLEEGVLQLKGISIPLQNTRSSYKDRMAPAPLSLVETVTIPPFSELETMASAAITGAYQSNRGCGRGDSNNGGSGGGYTRFSDRTPPPAHRPASSFRGRTSPAPVFPARGRGGYRAEGSGYISGGGHQYARGRVEQYPSSREGGRGRYGGAVESTREVVLFFRSRS